MSGFACLECGHKFKTVKAAEKAAFGDRGCPKCGGSDIDLAPARKPTKAAMTVVTAIALCAAAAKPEGGA